MLKFLQLLLNLGCVNYFAYGSNMNQKRLEARVGKVINLGGSFVTGFKLTWDCGNEKSAFANVLLDDKSVVHGVTYRMTHKQLRKLDHYEDTPLSYERMCDLDNKNRMIEIYINERKRGTGNGIPSDDYLQTVIAGAIQNKLPQNYIDSLKSIKSTGKNFMYK